MFELFTIEEVNLICIFDTSSRSSLISELSEALPDFIEPEMTEIAENVLKKLSNLTDADFSALEIFPEYEDYENERFWLSNSLGQPYNNHLDDWEG